MKNDTPKPYAKGFHVKSKFTGNMANILEEVSLENDTFVPGNSNYFLNLPLNVKPNAPIGESTVHFQVYGPGGKAWGDKIAIKLNVQKQLDQEEIYRLALKIFEQLNSKEAGLFDIVVEAVKESNNDEKLALQIINKKRFATDDEDLYA